MTTASVAKLKTVAGVDISKIDLEVLRTAYESTFKKKAEGEKAKLVEELTSFFQKTSKGGEILECENCGGGSPSALFPDQCPFCGEADDDASASPEPEAETKAKTNGVNGAAKAAPPEAPKSAPKVSAKKRTMKEEAPKAEETTSTAIVVPVASTAMVLTERDLDTSLVRLRVARDAGFTSLWALAVELRLIYDGNLWKLRNDEEGKPKYKNFAKFISEEVNLHERTCWRMIQVTKEFNEGQAKKYGVTILQGLLAAPKEDREEILEKVNAGDVKGTRGVRAEVDKIRKRKGVKVVQNDAKRVTPQGKAAAKAAAASSKKSAEEKKKLVTVAVPTGRKTVKLFVRALKKSDPEKRAKRLGDRPWGKLECANGVTMFFAIVENNAGELELSVEARRED